MPVARGSPPVTWPTIPGNESDGTGVIARVYRVPPRTSAARLLSGCVRTHQRRSDWCRPSTESSRTWDVVAGVVATPDRAPAPVVAPRAAPTMPATIAVVRIALIL